MISEHAYTAALNDTTTLDVKDGSAALDEGWSPYGQADITIATPVEEILDELDPRPSPRVTMTASSTEGSSRTFDLLVRSRTINHNDGTTDISLATDDALLQDYKRVATTTDFSNLTRQTSVRAIVSAVIDQAAGAVLEAGTADADFTTLDQRTNLILNPGGEVDASEWTNGGGSTISRTTTQHYTGTACIQATLAGASGATFICNTATYMPTSEGKTYAASVYARSNTAGASATVSIRYLDNSNAQLGANFTGPAVTLTTTGWQKLTTSAQAAPPLATRMAVYVSYYNTASGRIIYMDAAMLLEGDGIDTDTVTPVEPFDGDTPDTPLYNYTWSDPLKPSASTSQRTPVFSRPIEALTWEPGESAFDFLEPILTQAGLRLFCDEQRVWRLVDGSYDVPGLATIQQADNLYTAQDSIARDASAADGSPLWFDAVVIKYTWNDSENNSQTAYDVAAIDGYTQPALLSFDRPYPGPGAAAYILNRVTGHGRTLDLTARMDFSLTPGQAFSATVPYTETQTGRVSNVKWNFGSDDMAVGTRGLVDTPTDSWLLTPDALTWATVPGTTTWNSFHN